MQAERPVAAGLGIAVAVSGWMLVAADQTPPGRLPLEPPRDSGQSVTGAFEGWFRNPDGSLSMLAGYFNRNRVEALEIPIGPDNRIDPGGPDQGQPTHFLPRRHWGVFAVRVPKDFGNRTLTWTLVAHGQPTVIPLTLNPLYEVEPFLEAAMGNTPPVIRLEPGGRPHQGPPHGSSASFSATPGAPLTLTLWAADDPPKIPLTPLRRPTGPPPAPVTITWSKYRGPGPVAFSNAKPEVDQADGKTVTTATFEAPGEYMLRAQANDSSGEGGTAQCCWTNVLVNVSVK